MAVNLKKQGVGRVDVDVCPAPGRVVLGGHPPEVRADAVIGVGTAAIAVVGHAVGTHLDEAMRHLHAALELLPADDRRRRPLEQALRTTGRVRRGRPPKSGPSRAEERAALAKAGYTVEEIAAQSGVRVSTIERDLRMKRGR